MLLNMTGTLGKGNGRNTRGKKKDSNPETVSCKVDKSMLNALCGSLNQLQAALGLDPDLDQDIEDEGDLEEGDAVDIRGLISKLYIAVKSLTNSVNKIQSTQQDQEKRLRSQEDELDDIRQRSLKGSIIVSSFPNQAKGKPTLIKTEDQLKREGLTMQAHIISLVKDKYGICLPESDIIACHRLPKGTVLVKIWNRKEGSAWENLVNKIKSSENSRFNVLFNFQLTPKRSSLLYECRQLKKCGKIVKFFSDENGQIKIKIKPDSNEKARLTYVSKHPTDKPITFNKVELLKLVEC